MFRSMSSWVASFDWLSVFAASMLAWCILSVFYWGLARRVLHDAILFRIFKKRDELRALAIEGTVVSDSFEYQFLERRLCQAIYASPSITIFNFIRFCLSPEAKVVFPELERFCAVAPNNLKELLSSATDDLKRMILANSPIISFVAIVAMLITSVHHWVTERTKEFLELKVMETEVNQRAATV